jgi:AraC-like DNA-binding protein
MIIPFTFGTSILLIGIIIGIFTSGVLLFAPSNKLANRYLAALLFICVGALLHNFLLAAGIYDQFPTLYFLPVILSLGIGPLLYLYINRLIHLKKIKYQIAWMHLLPVLIQLLVYCFCFFQTPSAKYTIWKDYYEPFIKPIQIIAVYISVAIYSYLSFKEIEHYKLRLNYFYSNTEKMTLNWFQQLLYVFIFYYVLSVFFTIVSYSFKMETDYFPSDFIRCIIILLIAIFAIKQNSLLNIQHNLITIAEKEEIPLKVVVAEIPNIVTTVETTIPSITILETSSAISVEPEDAKPKEINTALLQKIIDVVTTEQLFLNPDLTIADVAEKMNFSTKTISHTINNGINKSFSKFINQFRVDLFKQKMASGKYSHLSILGLALECGFNSKSSFNRIFKEITGSSPKEYKY